MKRKKHPRLPNGFGSIRYCGSNRKNPYAVHPPGNIDGERPPALCYVDNWMAGFSVLTAYHAGTYVKGMEAELKLPNSTYDTDALIAKIIADYSRFRGVENSGSPMTFADVYRVFYADRYNEKHTFSQSTVAATRSGFKNCAMLHDRVFSELRGKDLQDALDACPLSHATQEHIVNLYHQMYKFADGQGWCEKRYDSFVSIRTSDDDENGIPFTDEELAIMWEHSDDPIIEFALIMCYSGWRISEFLKMDVDLEQRSYTGGLKTTAGKNRTVPIHSAVFPLVCRRMQAYGCLLPQKTNAYRKKMEQAWIDLGIVSDPIHTPHDCRHTFSRLCEKYEVRENDRKRMLGHAFKDVTNRVYGHRDLEDLRAQIEKIKKCDTL